MTRKERMIRRAERDAQFRASFDAMFPGILTQLDELTEMVSNGLTAGPKPGGKMCRPQEDYDEAINKLSGNLTIDPDVQQANIDSVADHHFHRLGGAI